MLLAASIACADVDQTNRTLIYGRENTFLLRLTKKMLQIAIDLTAEGNPLEGDHQLLRVLIEGNTVLKPEEKLTTLRTKTLKKIQLNDEAFINDTEHRKFEVVDQPLKRSATTRQIGKSKAQSLLKSKPKIAVNELGN